MLEILEKLIKKRIIKSFFLLIQNAIKYLIQENTVYLDHKNE